MINQGASQKSLIELFDGFGIDCFLYDIDLYSINSHHDKEYLLGILDKLKIKLLNVEVDFKKYSYIDIENQRKLVIIHDLEMLVLMSNGTCFGNLALQNRNNIRTATVQIFEDCILGRISQELYHDYISNEKQKTILKEIDFLGNNFFLKSIPVVVFKKKYYYDFMPVDLTKGNFIYNEKDRPDTIYFIKEGEVELSTMCTLLELSNKIEALVLKTKLVKNIDKYINDNGNKLN